jgi:hypothetical protein
VTDTIVVASDAAGIGVNGPKMWTACFDAISALNIIVSWRGT